MDTPESIAAELVRVVLLEDSYDGIGSATWAVQLDRWRQWLSRHNSPEAAKQVADFFRAAVVQACHRAVWAATSCGLTDAELLSPQRLAEIEGRAEVTLIGDVPALLAHIRTLERLLGDAR